MTTPTRHTIQLEVGGQRLRLTAASADPGHLERLAALVNGRVEKMQTSTRHPSPATLLALAALDLADEMCADQARHTRAQEAAEERVRTMLADCERRVREAEAESAKRIAEAEERAKKLVAESDRRARDVEAAARAMALEALAEIERAIATDDALQAREQKATEASETA